MYFSGRFPISRISRTEEGRRALFEVLEPPEELWIQGEPGRASALLARLPESGLAIVGTRTPQARARAWVRSVLQELRGAPLVIISGLAVGIDAEAHEAAIRAGLPTIAVVAHGLDLQYPRENAALRLKILEAGGLILSEFGFGVLARKYQFLRRNRLIAGWSRATWVVEAPERSGALNTAKWAREQHRTLFATPGFPGDPALAGCQDLLDAHAAVPIWGAHSFGREWLELATWTARWDARRRREVAADPATDEGKLYAFLAGCGAQSGGVTVPRLLDWAVAEGWAPERLFGCLQAAMQCGRIHDREGVLILQ